MINYLCTFKQKVCLFVIIFAINSQNTFCSQNVPIIDQFFQSNLAKKGSWSMLEPGKALTTNEINAIFENLDIEKTKIYCAESQNSENRDRGLKTLVIVCAYHDDSENKRERYPRMIFGPHQESATQ